MPIEMYDKWLKEEGIPVVRGYGLSDLMAVPLKPWPRKGGSGAYIFLNGCEGICDAYLCEIGPKSSLLPQRHMYEELIYILSGKGATSVWVENSAKQTVKWHEGSCFVIPLNSWHQHVNTQNDKPVRYLGGTGAPLIMNLFNSFDFIFNNDYIFKDRFNGEEGYFRGQSKLLEGSDPQSKRTLWETNFIPDCRTIKVLSDSTQEKSGIIKTHFQMSHGISNPSIHDFLVGRYDVADHHGGGSMKLVLNGSGYTLMWPAIAGINARGVERTRIDWHKYTLLTVPDGWYHQHFNTGKEPARCLGLLIGTGWYSKYKIVRKDSRREEDDLPMGPSTITYREEDPQIRKLYKTELAKTGAHWRMDDVFPGE
jgi:hypothetical protein